MKESPSLHGPKKLRFPGFQLTLSLELVGWALKVAAKWPSWQHIAKIPDQDRSGSVHTRGTLENLFGLLVTRPSQREPEEDVYLDLHDRLHLSNNLLGRFLNGTLYNIICAGLGVVIANIVHAHGDYIIETVRYGDPLSLILAASAWSLLIVAIACRLFQSFKPEE